MKKVLFGAQKQVKKCKINLPVCKKKMKIPQC